MTSHCQDYGWVRLRRGGGRMEQKLDYSFEKGFKSGLYHKITDKVIKTIVAPFAIIYEIVDSFKTPNMLHNKNKLENKII